MTEFDQQPDLFSAYFISNSHLPEVLPFLKNAVHYVSLALHGSFPTRWMPHDTLGWPDFHNTV